MSQQLSEEDKKKLLLGEFVADKAFREPIEKVHDIEKLFFGTFENLGAKGMITYRNRDEWNKEQRNRNAEVARGAAEGDEFNLAEEGEE